MRQKSDKNNSTHIPLALWTDKKGGEKIVVFSGSSGDEEVSFVVEEITEGLKQEEYFLICNFIQDKCSISGN